MSEVSQEVIDFVVANHTMNDNELMGKMVQMGVPFNKTKSVFNEILIANGLRMSKEDRDKKAADLMGDFTASEDSTTDDVEEMIENLMDELKCSVGIARSYVRAAFTEAEVDMPKATAVKRGPKAPGFQGDVKIAADWTLANPEGDYEAFKAHMKSLGKASTKGGTDKTRRWFGVIEDLRVFGKQWCDAGNC